MTRLHFTDRGKGKPILLIHGFPFNQVIWEELAELMATYCRVLTVDLPGFGRSPLLKTPFSLADVAATVNDWLANQEAINPILVGHSLGGYVALEMASLEPSQFSGLVLFHSTALPDTDEKRRSRDKVLEFIAKNGVKAFTSGFIPPLFADPNHPSVRLVREIASQAGEEAVNAYTLAMRNRKDNTALLRQFHNPIMIISGEQDAGIPLESLRKQAALSPAIDLHILPDVAHMGMFEALEKTAGLLKQFITMK